MIRITDLFARSQALPENALLARLRLAVGWKHSRDRDCEGVRQLGDLIPDWR
jgi:hypothetical protein